MMFFTSIISLSKANTLNVNAAYQDYKSIWRNKSRGALEAEIYVISKFALEHDSLLYKEALKSSDKLDILNGLLGELK